MAGIRTRKRGSSYSYIFEAGRDEDGRRKVVEKGGFKSETEAMDAGMDAYISWKHGDIGITSEKISLTDFIKQYVEIKKEDFSYSYLYTIVCRANNHIIPYLGKMSVQDINPLAVSKWLAILVKKGLAKKTINTTRAILHSIMEYAIFPAQLITTNPVVHIALPKTVRDNVNPHVAIPPEQFHEIMLQLGEFTPSGIVAMLQYHCGLRIGEAIGLTWDRLDLKKHALTVDRQMTATQRRFIPPKTSSSVRTIVVPPTLLEYLQRLYRHQLEIRMASGGQYLNAYLDGDNFLHHCRGSVPESGTLIRPLAVNDKGRLCHYSYVREAFGKFGFTSHSLRHSHATLLVEGNAPYKDIAARMGHADLSTTMNIYAHNTPAMQKQTVDIFESVLQKNDSKNTPCRQNADK